MDYETTVVIVCVITTMWLVTINTGISVNITYAQSSDPGAIGEINRDSPLGQKISSGDAEPGRELRQVGCTSDFASGEKTNNPHCQDEDDE